MADWQELTDPGSGRTYFFSPSTGTTQCVYRRSRRWVFGDAHHRHTHPTNTASRRQPRPTPSSRLHPPHLSLSHLPPGNLPRRAFLPRRRWDKPADFGGGESAATEAAAWTVVKDDASGRTYYYNDATGVTQWDPPPGFEATASATSGGAGAEAVSG
jgi:hypothetical protein